MTADTDYIDDKSHVPHQTSAFMGISYKKEYEIEESDGEKTSSEILTAYLKNLGYCTKKKRRRCISQELG